MSFSDDEGLAKALAQMVKDVWQTQGMPYLLNATITQAFADELFKGVLEGFGNGFDDIEYNTPDYNMLASLQRDVYHFSAAKNYQQLKALTGAIVDGEGKVRNYSQFKKAAYEINDQHINQWLRTEYDTAIGSAQMAGKWVDITENTATVLLQFDVILDNRTSVICRPLDGVKKPPHDLFWDMYYPPNHFNCRSTVRQLNEGEETPGHNIEYPEKVPAMFKTNMAKRGLVFPPEHPYYDGVPESVLSKAELMYQKSKHAK